MKKAKLVLLLIGVVLAIALILGGVYIFGFYLPEKKEQAEFHRLMQEYYDQKLALYEAENQTYADYEVDVAFIGDSLTDGYDVAQYYPQYTVVNRGIGGDTTHGVEERLQVSLYDLKPKVVVMLIGANNMSTMFENYERILLGLKDNLPNTKVILVSLTAMGGSWGHKNQLATYNNVTIKKLAAKYGFTFIDLFTPLFDETTGEIYASYTTDGGHLTAEGYEVFTATVAPIIQQLLEEQQ